MKYFRFLSVALNPAMDILLHSKTFLINQKNIIDSAFYFPGGKGFNVAVILAKLKQAVSVIGFVGCGEEHIFSNTAKSLNMGAIFVNVNEKTRVNYKIINDQYGHCTEFNQKGFNISEKSINELFDLFNSVVPKYDYVSISGSLPPGVPQDIYGSLITITKKNNVQCGLDASGKALFYGVASSPQVLRINLNEIEELTGEKLTSSHQITGAIEPLHKKGIRLVVVSMGDRGAIASDGKEIWQAIPPRISSVNPIGAGDAMMAGCLYELAMGSPLSRILKFSTALATTSVHYDNIQEISIDEVDKTVDDIRLIRIS